jgi:hypothetical protein
MVNDKGKAVDTVRVMLSQLILWAIGEFGSVILTTDGGVRNVKETPEEIDALVSFERITQK